MRQLMLLLVAVGMLGSLVGCKNVHTHGVCDCDMDEHCSTRSPWIRQAAPPMSNYSETIPAPATKLPVGKQL